MPSLGVHDFQVIYIWSIGGSPCMTIGLKMLSGCIFIIAILIIKTWIDQ